MSTLPVEMYMYQKISSNTRKSLHKQKDLEPYKGRLRHVYQHNTFGKLYADQPLKNHEAAFRLIGFPEFLAKDTASLIRFTHEARDYDQIIQCIPLQKYAAEIAGIANREPAYPRGGFATAQEYEQYIMLYVNRRDDEIPAYLAGLAGGPVFNPRDPFPHGHCYLNLLPRDKQTTHYRRGQDYLTKEKLAQIWPDIKKDKVICYIVRAATTDAHVSLEKDPPVNAILLTAEHLATKLRDAFEDAVVDWEEYQEIYFHAPITHRA